MARRFCWEQSSRVGVHPRPVRDIVQPTCAGVVRCLFLGGLPVSNAYRSVFS